MIFGCNDDEELFGSDIQLGDEVYATDPAYTPDLWCCNLIKGFKPGSYQPYAAIEPEEDRVAELVIYHESHDRRLVKERLDWMEAAEIAVDSGQAGFFEKSFYIEGKKTDEANENKSFDELTGFYKDCCDITIGEDPYGVLENHLGIVSASGYGDGCYPLYVAKDSAGKIVAAKIVFIDTHDEDDYWNDEEDEEEEADDE